MAMAMGMGALFDEQQTHRESGRLRREGGRAVLPCPALPLEGEGRGGEVCSWEGRSGVSAGLQGSEDVPTLPPPLLLLPGQTQWQRPHHALRAVLRCAVILGPLLLPPPLLLQKRGGAGGGC